MKLPELSIRVFHRADGKGSNYILSDYLAKVSPEFLATAGRGESPKWPVGQAFQRSQDLVAKLRNTPGAIGYTELNLAASSGVRFASIKNAAGEFIKPSTKSIGAAASSSGSKMTHDFRISLTNAPGKDSYPISSFTWLYVPVVAKDPARGRAVADYLKWVYSSGQKIAQEQAMRPCPRTFSKRSPPKPQLSVEPGPRPAQQFQGSSVKMDDLSQRVARRHAGTAIKGCAGQRPRMYTVLSTTR